jgi:hypothetical protein
MRLPKFLIILMCVFLALLWPLAAYAVVTDPDSISVVSVRIFQNVWSTGDELFLVEQKVMHSINQSSPSTDTFLVRVTSTSANYSVPLPYYQHGLSAIYLTAAQAVTWGSTANITVAGNPAFYPTLTEGVNQRTSSLGPGNWISGTETDSRSYLQAWCVTLADELQTSWGITLLDTNDKLNAVGAQYFSAVIPGLTSVCPNLFAVSSDYVTPDTSAHPKTYETDLLSRMGIGLHDAVQGIANVIGIPFTLTGLLLVGIMFFIVAGRIFTATGSPAMTIPIAIPFLFVATIIGLIPLSAVFFVIAVVVVLGAITFVLARVG